MKNGKRTARKAGDNGIAAEDLFPDPPSPNEAIPVTRRMLRDVRLPGEAPSLKGGKGLKATRRPETPVLSEDETEALKACFAGDPAMEKRLCRRRLTEKDMDMILDALGDERSSGIADGTKEALVRRLGLLRAVTRLRRGIRGKIK